MTPAAESTPTGIEAKVCVDIAARQAMGIRKYGKTVEESADDMLQHAYEEALDLAIYLKAEIERRREGMVAADEMLREFEKSQGFRREPQIIEVAPKR